jgi:hypothetical protein
MSGCGTGTILTLDPLTFRQSFPAFANPVQYTDATLGIWFGMATTIISDIDYGFLNGTARQNALYLVTAHIMQLGINAAGNDGASPGFITEAQVDKVRVQVQPPPVKSQLGWWFNQTAYGAQLWAMLQLAAVGGMYIGGAPELSAFRRVGGFTSPGGRW